MKSVRFHVKEERAVPCSDLAARIGQVFGPAAPGPAALCLWEATDRARLFVLDAAELAAMADEAYWERCHACRICNSGAELRIEKYPFAAEAACRLLCDIPHSADGPNGPNAANNASGADSADSADSTDGADGADSTDGADGAQSSRAALARDSSYVLRRPINSAHAELSLPGRAGRLGYREYFLPDADGWLTLVETRLTGLWEGERA